MNENAAIDLVNNQKKSFADMLKNQANEESNFFSDYNKQITSQAPLQEVLRQAQNQRGMSDLQNTINLFQGESSNVKGLLDRLPEQLKQRTAGTFTTQALLDRQNSVEGGALRTQLSRLAAGLEPVVNAYTSASNDTSQLLDATAQQYQRELLPFSERVSFLGDRFAREATGYTQNSENELNVLLDKLQRERTLADREYQRAKELADKEADYQYKKKLAAQEYAYKSYLGVGNTSSSNGASSSVSSLPGAGSVSAPTYSSTGSSSGPSIWDYLGSEAGNIGNNFSRGLSSIFNNRGGGKGW